MDWTISREYCGKNNLKKFTKQHRDEALQCFTNLERFLNHLNEYNPENTAFVTGIVRQEGGGLVAADTRGLDGSHRVSRLYAWPCKTNRTIYILRIGDKDTQTNDIRECRSLITRIKKRTLI